MKITFDLVVHLLHEASWGSLATHSTQVSGYPFASIVPFAMNEQHQPVFLISDVAEHTKNLDTDFRAGFLVQKEDGRNILAGERLSIVGDAERIAPSQALVECYLRYHPDAEQYLTIGGFDFFQLVPKRARYIIGFGQMRWIEGAEWTGAVALSLDEEADLILELAETHPRGVRVLGIDRYGFDLEQDGKRERQRFANAPITADQIGDVVRRFLAAM